MEVKVVEVTTDSKKRIYQLGRSGGVDIWVSEFWIDRMECGTFYLRAVTWPKELAPKQVFFWMSE